MPRPVSSLCPFALSLVVLVIGGCDGGCSSRSSGPPAEAQKVLEAVRWSETGAEGPLITEASFQTLAEDALGEEKITSRTDLKIVIAGEMAAEDGTGAVAIDAHVRVEGLEWPLKVAIAASGPARDGASAAALATRALSDLSAALAIQLELTGADPGRLIRALDSPEPDEQVLALKLLGRVQSPEAIPAIARHLGDPRVPVAEAAAEALAAIGDERAVPHLIASIDRGNLRSEVRAIEAMGRIGGREAVAYLEMTALGHEVSEVRSLSKALLKSQRSAGE